MEEKKAYYTSSNLNEFFEVERRAYNDSKKQVLSEVKRGEDCSTVSWTEERLIPSYNIHYCPKCGVKMGEGEHVCSNCRSLVTDLKCWKYCPRCGTIVNDKETICPSCLVSIKFPNVVKYCVACGTYLPQDAMVCPRCNSIVRRTVKQKDYNNSRALSEKRGKDVSMTPQIAFCPHCKEKVQQGWVSCPYCGSKLKNNSDNNPREIGEVTNVSDKGAKPMKKRTAVGLVLLFLAFVVFLVYLPDIVDYSGNDNNDTENRTAAASIAYELESSTWHGTLTITPAKMSNGEAYYNFTYNGDDYWNFSHDQVSFKGVFYYSKTQNGESYYSMSTTASIKGVAKYLYSITYDYITSGYSAGVARFKRK